MSEDRKMKWVMVDTVSQHRMRYLVEVPEDQPEEWALDTVTCEEALEFSQEFIGETIISHRVVTKEEALIQFDKDNDYLIEWDEELKIRNSLTTWEAQLPKPTDSLDND
jgi:Holliday junction resolvase